MAQLQIRDETYSQLVRKAEQANMTLEAFVEPALVELANLPLEVIQPAARQEAFDAWQRQVQARGHRYPPGQHIDDRRATIYGEREDRQQ